MAARSPDGRQITGLKCTRRNSNQFKTTLTTFWQPFEGFFIIKKHSAPLQVFLTLDGRGRIMPAGATETASDELPNLTCASDSDPRAWSRVTVSDWHGRCQVVLARRVGFRLVTLSGRRWQPQRPAGGPGSESAAHSRACCGGLRADVSGSDYPRASPLMGSGNCSRSQRWTPAVMSNSPNPTRRPRPGYSA